MKSMLYVRSFGAVLFFLHFFLSSGCFDWECAAEKIQEVNGLSGKQRLVAYIRNCGATTDYTINVSFVRPDLDMKKETGDVFFANHGIGVQLEKVSPDTIKIFYSATDVIRKKSRMKGIYFIYERDGKRFLNKEGQTQP